MLLVRLQRVICVFLRGSHVISGFLGTQGGDCGGWICAPNPLFCSETLHRYCISSQIFFRKLFFEIQRPGKHWSKWYFLLYNQYEKGKIFGIFNKTVCVQLQYNDEKHCTFYIFHHLQTYPGIWCFIPNSTQNNGNLLCKFDWSHMLQLACLEG